MTHQRASTIWPPVGIPGDVKKLVDLYFALVDSKEKSAGPRLASEVFTSDGEFFASTGYFKGQDIAASRDHVWDNFEARHHKLRKAYTNDADGLDLILIGLVDLNPLDAEPVTVEFVVRVLISTESTGPRIKYYRPLIPAAAPDQPILAEHEK